MPVSQYSAASDQLNETIVFTQGMLQASAVLMFWIDPSLNLHEAHRVGVTAESRQEYDAYYYAHDPLDANTLIKRQERTVFLQEERLKRSPESINTYIDYLNSHGITDEVDFLLWQENRPFALICTLKREGDPPFRAEQFQWETMRGHLQYVLQQHPHVLEARRHEVLAGKFNLTSREIEVIELLKIGASNAKIADLMNIGISTVKTYIINILNKLGVNSRFEAVAYISTM